MVRLTQSERLAVLEEKLESVDKKLERYFQESKEFHRELIDKLEKLDGEKVQIATLKEKVKTLERLVWAAILGVLGTIVNAIMDLI